MWVERQLQTLIAALITEGKVGKYLQFLEAHGQHDTLKSLLSNRIAVSSQVLCAFPEQLQAYLQPSPRRA